MSSNIIVSQSINSSKFNSDAFWQHVIALDVQFNSLRYFCSYFKMLYIKRRNQLFRDLSKSELNSFRKRYIKLRHTILSKKYVKPTGDQKMVKLSHIRNNSDSSFLSFIYDDLVASSDMRKPLTITPNDLLCEDRIPSVTQSIAFCENFSFSGVHHIFDQHTDSVGSIKFANKDKSLLCAASADCTLSICQLTPSPATILFILRGHKGPITAFEWSHSNDLIVSCSTDRTLRLWSTTNGTCRRVFHDPQNASISICAFHPNNNNMIVTGNSVGILNILNLSTGIYSKNTVTVCDGHIHSMRFQLDGNLLWVGDFKGFISTFRFEMENSRLVLVNKVIVVAGCAITSLSTLYQNEEDLLLANCACNAVVLFKCSRGVSSSLEFIKSFPIKHQSPNLLIKSSFCPKSVNNQNICIVTGSEDTCIYFYAFVGSNKNRCVNKLQGHSSPILDVCFNFEESLLASADSKGNIIVWKRE